MKIVKSLIFIIIFILLSIFTIGVQIEKGISVSAMKTSRPIPTSYAKKLPQKIIVSENLILDNPNITNFEVYEPVRDIKFSGKFMYKDFLFELSIYNFQEKDLNTWLVEHFAPYQYGDKDFTDSYLLENSSEISQGFYRIPVYYRSDLYTVYLNPKANSVTALIVKNKFVNSYVLEELFNLINFKNVNINKVKTDLNTLDTFLKSKTKGIKNQTFGISFRENIVKADNVTYYLPWPKDISYMVTQDWGANDNPPCDPNTCSHYVGGFSGYAYDFGMPEDSQVLASATGTVTFVDGSHSSCGGLSMVGEANYITISHSDGKATEYHHLKGTVVNIGDTVQQGQLIGYSGKTGYTAFDGVNCAAHLHFQKQAQGGQYTQSEPFYFAEYPNAPSGELEYPGSYTSQNENQLSANICSGLSTMVIGTTKSNFTCGVSSGGWIYMQNNARINPESRLYVE